MGAVFARCLFGFALTGGGGAAKGDEREDLVEVCVLEATVEEEEEEEGGGTSGGKGLAGDVAFLCNGDLVFFMTGGGGGREGIDNVPFWSGNEESVVLLVGVGEGVGTDVESVGGALV